MKLNKFLALLLSIAMLLTLTLGALAENAATEPATMSDDTVLATVNGENVTWGDMVLMFNSYYASYGSYVDESVIKTIALQETVDRRVLLQKAKELGLDAWSDEEKAAADQSAQENWDSAIESYLSAQGLAEDATEEEKQQKRDEGSAAFLAEGYSVERLSDFTRQTSILNRVTQYLQEQNTPTDEQVQARYNERLTTDQEKYQADAASYIQALNAGEETPLYRPEGLRQVKHILLGVDDTLMNSYNDLLARLEEQADAEASTVQSGEANAADPTADPAAEPTATETPVTQADVDVAKAAILDSLKEKIDDINTRFADGEDFDVLIDEYNTDPGMQSAEGKAKGYEVSQDSVGYIPEFITGTFSIAAPGEISAPVLGSYGVHIIYYMSDLPAGVIELTDAVKAELKDAMITDGTQTAYQAWLDAAQITYTGVIQSYDELMGAQNDGDVDDASATDATVEP